MGLDCLLDTLDGMKIWLEDWEWQCCGEPFAVGSEVEWGLMPLSSEDRLFLIEPLGAETVDGLTHVETHHEDARDPVQPVRVRARVEAISAVYWARAPHSGDDERVLYPVSGTAVLESRETADGWEPEHDALRFEGYIVELRPLDALSEPE
jgi:hypothetical protein